MRIGTWNLEGRWSANHLALLQHQACDVWLLTEVPSEASVPGMTAHRTQAAMGPRKDWAGVFSNLDISGELDPHWATAMAQVDGLRVLSSVLPWRSCGATWQGASLTEKMTLTLAQLREHIDGMSIWGGDWNLGLEGSELVGSSAARAEILALLEDAGLSVPTRSLGSVSKGQRSIDHVAVPIAWDVTGAHRVEAAVRGRRLSDHDAYVVSVTL